jgi:hypothetical protein
MVNIINVIGETGVLFNCFLATFLQVKQWLQSDQLMFGIGVSLDRTSHLFDIDSTLILIYTDNTSAGSRLNQRSSLNSYYYDYLYTNSLCVADRGNHHITKFSTSSKCNESVK